MRGLHFGRGVGRERRPVEELVGMMRATSADARSFCARGGPCSVPRSTAGRTES